MTIKSTEPKHILATKIFWINKRIFDVLVSLILLPVLILSLFLLIILNVFFNPGKVLFIQKRMGKNCKAFNAYKFRTMKEILIISRKFDEPLEENRITSLGKILREIRLDELPQIINVLKGEMSLIGPRPDYYEHALVYLEKINGYRDRHIVRPGITGLSQIRLGYVESLDAAKKKSNTDNYYIKNIGYRIEIKIIISTIYVIFKRLGN